MIEQEFLKDIFRNSRLEAVCKCASILVASDHPDLARAVLKAMNINEAQLALMKKAFAGG